jgi:cytoskeletal protein CcmA (bactofilin family)
MLYGNANSAYGAGNERPGTETRQAARAEDTTQAVPVLGKTLLFRGELTAEEDVILQGRVEGSIRHARNLIIGTDGSVLGDVYASHLTVEGLIEGDLHGSEAVLVRATAQVRGNIFAPRVGIMEGALFNGRIEMDPNAAAQSVRPGVRAGNARPAAPRGSAAGAAGTVVPPGALATGPLAGSAADQLLSATVNKK